MSKPVREGKALVLLSGGIDSTTALALAAQECESTMGVTIHYGQSHAKEIRSAEQVAEYYEAPLVTVSLPSGIFDGYGSTLIDHGLTQPQATYQELMDGFGASPTYVPFRNANLLAVATAVAMTHKFDFVYWAPHATDAHHNAYPDCTPEFSGAMANAILIGSDQKVRLVTPFQWMTKDDIVRLGLELAAPYHLTWSCYEGKDLHCGRCPTCVERIHAFTANLVVDPLAYETPVAWDNCSLFLLRPSTY